MKTEQSPLNLAKRLLLNLLRGFVRKRWTLECSREGRGGEIKAAHGYHLCDKSNVLRLRRAMSNYHSSPAT